MRTGEDIGIFDVVNREDVDRQREAVVNAAFIFKKEDSEGRYKRNFDEYKNKIEEDVQDIMTENLERDEIAEGITESIADAEKTTKDIINAEETNEDDQSFEDLMKEFEDLMEDVEEGGDYQILH